MRIALRADGGPKVGLGHLGRCAALAQAFRARGARPVFVEVDGSCAAWVKGRGFPLGRLSDGPWDMLVADSYRFTPRDWRAMRGAARALVAIEDRSRRPAAADAVLNGLACARPSRPDDRRRVTGPRFMLLRREYWTPAPRRRTRPVVTDFLVTLGGGTDRGHLRAAADLAAKSFPLATVHVVVPPLGRAPRSLPPRARVHRAPKSLRPLLLRADAGLCAGGQTLCEFAAAGTPAVALELGPDQRANIRAFAAAGAALPAGRPVSGWERAARRVLAALTPAKREAMSAAGPRLVDGRGALRAAEALLETVR